MADPSENVAPAIGLGYADVRGWRAAISPYVFRSMLVGMAAVAIAMDRITGKREIVWQFAKGRARDLTKMLGVDVTVRGVEHLEQGGPFIYTPNHQSHLDILALLGFLPGRTRFAAKKELWRHPVVGGVLDTLDMVPIDRDNPETAMAALDRADGTAGSLVVFPEGTRSRDGQLRPFKKGAFVLAIRTGLPVVPIICRGTRRLMPRGSRLTVVPGPVEIIVEPPIPTAGLRYEDRDELAARVRAAIERHHTGW